MVAEGSGDAGRRPRVRRLGLALLLALLAAVLVGTGAFVGFRAGWRASPPPIERSSSDTVAVQIQRIARLATVEASEAEILQVDESTPVLYLFQSTKNALLLARGRVLAGVDLQQAQVTVVEEDGARRLEVVLPPARILAVDPEVEFYDEQSGWMNPITLEDRNAWIKRAQEGLRRAALRHGILRQADEHARRIVRAVGTGLGYRVEFVPPPSRSEEQEVFR